MEKTKFDKLGLMVGFNQIKSFILDIIFPAHCLNCQKEGSYLCPDCLSLIEITIDRYCPFCSSPKIVLDGKTCPSCRKSKKLTGVISAASYQNPLVKRVVSQFKYQPFIKELAKTFASLIIQHLESNKKPLDFSQAVLVPLPLHKKRLKWRGFNQAEEIAKELSLFWKVPLLADALARKKETRPQVELSGRAREENVKDAFSCKSAEKIKDKIVFLIDDVFTTGSTMEESARVLKQAGAKEVWGVVAARG